MASKRSQFLTVELQRSKSSASVHGGARIETPVTCAFNIHSSHLSILYSGRKYTEGDFSFFSLNQYRLMNVCTFIFFRVAESVNCPQVEKCRDLLLTPPWQRLCRMVICRYHQNLPIIPSTLIREERRSAPQHYQVSCSLLGRICTG